MDLKEFNTSAYLTAMSGRLIKKNEEDARSIIVEAMEIISYITEIIPYEELCNYDVNKIAKNFLECGVDHAFSKYVRETEDDSNYIATLGHYRLGSTYEVKKLDRQLYKRMNERLKRS